MARSSHLLCLIVDCNTCWWGELAESSEDNAVTSMIHSLAAFCNAHSAQNAANRLLVLGAAHGLSSSLIYSTYSAKPSDDPCATINTGVQRCLQESASSSTSSKECPLAGPLATALCHINRTRKEER
uniref:General transcription factor IIH subunit 3 n=1 Tax=Plectus sambesii TaxID=2011161 RepID=A0A914VN43_9BILA